MENRLIIAIDGYSSCGKSTVAKELARIMGLHYIDSGAMYRAVTLFFLENNFTIPHTPELKSTPADYSEILQQIHISFRFNPENGCSEVYLNGRNVEKEIRTMAVNENVSHVSTIKEVRKRLVSLQQMAADSGGLVMDGRDIGTTVFPGADLKIFMTADPKVRARRRFEELKERGIQVTEEEILKNVLERDYEDSHREESPLRKADDAIVLDNTTLSRDEQIRFVIDKVNEVLFEKAGMIQPNLLMPQDVIVSDSREKR